MDWMRFLFAMGICFFFMADLRAQPLPSEIDLKATYCIPIVKQTLDVLTSAQAAIANDSEPESSEIKRLTEKWVTEERDNLRRLQLYIMPRAHYLDTSALLAAHKRGEEDASRSSEVADICGAKCKGAQDKSSCVQLCGSDYDVTHRMKICRDVGWLPF